MGFPTGQWVNTRDGGARMPAMKFVGKPYIAGDGNTDQPLFLMQPDGTADYTAWALTGTFFGINMPGTLTADFVRFVQAGSAKFFVNSSGSILTAGSVASIASSNNSRVQFTTNGLVADRNIADANPCLIVNQINAGSTGDLLQLQAASATKVSVTFGGVLTLAVNNGINFTNQSNGAAAAAGTLTNAPAAGNPTFWLPVQIAGANKFIPCW